MPPSRWLGRQDMLHCCYTIITLLLLNQGPSGVAGPWGVGRRLWVPHQWARVVHTITRGVWVCMCIFVCMCVCVCVCVCVCLCVRIDEREWFAPLLEVRASHNTILIPFQHHVNTVSTPLLEVRAPYNKRTLLMTSQQSIAHHWSITWLSALQI
jgi:hypothetical protein